MDITKGEWTVGREHDADFHAKLIIIGTDYFRDGGFDFICYVNDIKEAKANAQLIASAPDMVEEIETGKEWLGKFVMRFYAEAKRPTYENMKALYQELDDFQRVFGNKALAKAKGS